MMSRVMFASEEVISFEGSPVEPTHVDHPESHMRYYENVVYIPQVLPPTMVLEYRPVFYNFQTYEPYLINRYPVPEVFESSVQNEDDTHYNNYPEISLDDVISDYLYDINSSTSLSDATSVLSLPRSDSSNTYEQTDFNSFTQESCESSQVCTESNKNLDPMCHDEHNSAQEYPEACFSESDADGSIEAHTSNLSFVLVDDEKGPHELDCTGNYLIPASFHEDDHVESDVLSPSLLTDGEKPGGLPDSAKIEASSLTNIAKDRNISPERRENHTVFDSDMESCVSSSLVYAERCQDENGLEHGQVLSVKNKKVKTYDSPSSPQMPIWSQGTPLQNPGSLPKIDAMVPDPLDDANSERENDDPTISLRDILASEEYWRLKREEYFHKRRITQLYRSALEGDIRPKRSLPEVGTLATIFEDLPYPVNEPYDDGVQLDQESVKEEYFELLPLDVKRSKSSHTTLLPKKKRFRNTRKFFSGLMRCFKPR